MMFIWVILVSDMKMANGHWFWYHLIGHRTKECEILLVCLWIHFDCWEHYDGDMDFEALCDWNINLLNESCKWKIGWVLVLNDNDLSGGIGCLWWQCMWLGIFVVYVCRILQKFCRTRLFVVASLRDEAMTKPLLPFYLHSRGVFLHGNLLWLNHYNPYFHWTWTTSFETLL